MYQTVINVEERKAVGESGMPREGHCSVYREATEGLARKVILNKGWKEK